MNMPARPTYQSQDPNDGGSCQLAGRELGWLNCTPTSTAMGVQKATIGKRHPSGCDIRRNTRDGGGSVDTTGGTTLEQCANAVRRVWGLPVDVHAGGAGAASPSQVAGWLHAGRGMVVQGNAGALLDTTFRSTGGFVNHAVYVNEGRGWHRNSAGVLVPGEVFAFDPAANGRQASWGHADRGPSWWPWSLLQEFASKLRPWGDADHRTLGPGKLYCMVFQDTEPHAHLRYRGTRELATMPRIMTSDVPAGKVAHVRTGPSTRYPLAAKRSGIPRGQHFTAYQRTDVGQEISGSRVWFGSHGGRRWVHSSSLK